VDFKAFRAVGGEFHVKFKYLSYWCSNPVALTIYVNANELRFSPTNGQPFALCLHKVQARFHPRG